MDDSKRPVYVTIPEVRAFPNVKADKAQALKPLEEAAEVFGAWQECQITCGASGSIDCSNCIYVLGCSLRNGILYECADLIQATCNLVASLGIENMRGFMDACRRRNEERGRYEVRRQDVR